MTIVLTTHYLEEAEALADRVVVLAGGLVVAEGPPDELGGQALSPSPVRLRGVQVRDEQKAYWRNPASAFFTFAFPLVFLVIFAALNNGSTIDSLGGLAYNQFFIPAIIAFGSLARSTSQRPRRCPYGEDRRDWPGGGR